MGERRATLARVAALAGVSPSTASLAFNSSGPVADATRERVLAAARELGYIGPDPIASSLRRGRSGIVGAIIGERLLYAFRDPVAVALLDGLAEILTPAGAGLLLVSGDAERTGPTPDQVARMPLDAAVFATCGADDDPLLEHFLERGIPVVAVDGPDRPDVALVDVDDYGGTAELVRHLRDTGHSRVATATLPLRLDGRRGVVDTERRAAIAFADCRHRLKAVEDAFGAVLAVETAANLIEEGEQAAHLLLNDPLRRPTAIIAQSDLIAVGAIRAAESLGLRIPDDLTVVGFDGIETPWLGAHMLSTVVQPTADKGRAAGRMVTGAAGERPDRVHLPVQVRIGTTSAPPPRR